MPEWKTNTTCCTNLAITPLIGGTADPYIAYLTSLYVKVLRTKFYQNLSVSLGVGLTKLCVQTAGQPDSNIPSSPTSLQGYNKKWVYNNGYIVTPCLLTLLIIHVLSMFTWLHKFKNLNQHSKIRKGPQQHLNIWT